MTTQLTIPEAIELAWQHHQGGRLQEAEAIYRQILAAQPDHSDALHLLGMLALQLSQPAAAVDLIQRAIAINPSEATYHCNLGQALAATGQVEAGITAYRQAIQLRSDFAEAHVNLGNALQGLGQLDEAIESLERALELRPDFAAAAYNLGIAHRAAGRLKQAIAAFRKAIEIQPDMVDAHYNLATTLQAAGQVDQAVAEYVATLEIAPDHFEACNNLGAALHACGQAKHAAAAFRQAAVIRPDSAEAYNNLSNVLREQGQIDQAVAAARQAVQLKPDFPEAYNNLGSALLQAARFEDSLAAYRQAIAIDPKYAMGHYNLGCALLQRGDFPRGWPEYEWRAQATELGTQWKDFTRPRWDGSDLKDRSILLHAEQGFGDTLQFARYIPKVIERGGNVSLVCPDVLVRLMGSIPGIKDVVPFGEIAPSFHEHCPLLSLPLIFGTTLQSIPTETPYLRADAKRVEHWGARLASHGAGRKIGLCWTGRAFPDMRRSIPAAELASLSQLSDVTFVSLQKDEGGAGASESPPDIKLLDWTDELDDFADSAALIQNLDMVLTIDTAVAHLAGAMGKPTWVMLTFIPDWRWLLNRTDSPWYPSMRLFRQTTAGDWSVPVAQVTQALQSL